MMSTLSKRAVLSGSRRSKFAMRAALTLAIALLCLASQAQAQTAISWQATAGTIANEWATGSAPTSDGGFIVGGRQRSTTPGSSVYYWIEKLGADHLPQWQRSYGGGGANYDQMMDVVALSSGGYMLAGISNSNAGGDKSENSLGGNDYWLLWTDALGNVVFDDTIGGSGADSLTSVVETPSGGYYVAGYSSSPANGDKTEGSRGGSDLWILKLNASYHIEWQRTIGGSGADTLLRNSVALTADGGLIVGGASTSGVGFEKSEPSQGGNDYWVVKLDAAGNTEWDRTYGGSGDDFVTGILQNRDGDYLVVGKSNSGISGDKTSVNYGDEDVWALKLNAQGALTWQAHFGGSQSDVATAAVQTIDDGYALVAYSESGGTGPNPGNKYVPNYGLFDYWTIKIDSMGQQQWQNGRGSTGDDKVYSISETPGGDLVLGGYSDSPAGFDKATSSQNYDAWLIALNYWHAGLSAFHFEDPYGSVTSTFLCGNFDIYLNGAASQNETRYYIDAWRRPIGSGASFAWVAALGWDVGFLGTINLTQEFGAVGFNFDPGYEYEIKVAVQNLPYFGWVDHTETFVVPTVQYFCSHPTQWPEIGLPVDPPEFGQYLITDVVDALAELSAEAPKTAGPFVDQAIQEVLEVSAEVEQGGYIPAAIHLSVALEELIAAEGCSCSAAIMTLADATLIAAASAIEEAQWLDAPEEVSAQVTAAYDLAFTTLGLGDAAPVNERR